MTYPKLLSAILLAASLSAPAHAMAKKPLSPAPMAPPVHSEPAVTDRSDYRSWYVPAAYDGNAVKLFETGDESFAARLAAIEQAKRTIYVSTFIWENDKIGMAVLGELCKKAEQGVDVRILVDWKGSRDIEGYKDDLRGCGAKILFFNRGWDLGEIPIVLHEKLLMIDGETVFTGGTNYADNYAHYKRDDKVWYDFDAKIDGPVACWFHNRFVDSYRQSVYAEQDSQRDAMGGGGLDDEAAEFFFAPSTLQRCQPVVKGDIRIMPLHYDPVFWRDRPIKDMYLNAIRTSHDLIRIYSPYFVPGKEIIQALLDARKRGVKVQVITNSRYSVDEDPMVIAAVYREGQALIDAGVEVRLWQGKNMMHRKGQIYDGKVATIGSENFDRHALDYASEDLVVLDNQPIVNQLMIDFDTDFASSKPLTKDMVRTDLLRDFSGLQRFISKLLVNYI